jgi:hypothetical protein
VVHVQLGHELDRGVVVEGVHLEASYHGAGRQADASEQAAEDDIAVAEEAIARERGRRRTIHWLQRERIDGQDKFRPDPGRSGRHDVGVLPPPAAPEMPSIPTLNNTLSTTRPVLLIAPPRPPSEPRPHDTLDPLPAAPAISNLPW